MAGSLNIRQGHHDPDYNTGVSHFRGGAEGLPLLQQRYSAVAYFRWKCDLAQHAAYGRQTMRRNVLVSRSTLEVTNKPPHVYRRSNAVLVSWIEAIRQEQGAEKKDEGSTGTRSSHPQLPRLAGYGAAIIVLVPVR